MNNNLLIKIICSVPVILIMLYFIPFLGFILILARLFLVQTKNKYNLSVFLIIIGLLIYVPYLLKQFNIYDLSMITQNEYYLKLMNTGKIMIIYGFVFILLIAIISKLESMGIKFIKDYINKEEENENKIKEKNDLIMQEKREKAKNTGVVVCPHCGNSNLLSEKTGKCKYCRSNISQK